MFRSLPAAVLSVLLIALPAWGAPVGDQPAGEVKALIPDATRNAKPVAVKDALQWNDLLKTLAKGRLRAGLADGSILSVGANSELKVVQHDASSQQTVVEMNYGKLRNQVVKITQPGGKYEVKTPNVVAGVIGTDFYIAYENKRTTVICYEGKVLVTPVAEANAINHDTSKQTSTSIVVAAGQMVAIGTIGTKDQTGQSQAIPAPPAVVQASLSETDIPDIAASQPGSPGSRDTGLTPSASQPGSPGSRNAGLTPTAPQPGSPGSRDAGLAPAAPQPPSRNWQEKIPASPPPFDSGSEKQLWELMNQERTTRGLPPLQPDEGLTLAARQHSVVMAQNRTLSHQFPGEPSPEVRLGYQNVRFDRASENVATAMNAPAAHQSLMESPPHRAAILNSEYDSAGIAVTRNGNFIYVTEAFAHVLPNSPVADPGGALQNAIANYAFSHGFPPPTAKPEARLQEMARSMALNGAPDGDAPRQIDGVERVLIWVTPEPSRLPGNVADAISQPLPGGYSVGAFFAASTRFPRGIYWMVMVTY
jgi:uncharacterized protein YkwD